MEKIIVVFLVSISILVGCGSTIGQQITASKVDYFADNGLGNALAIVQHPAGVHHEGVTYVSYQGPLEDPYVASYNHATAEWAGPFKAGVSDLGKGPDAAIKVDNHGKPTMVIDDLGYIHIFFGGHGGDKHHGTNPLGNIHKGGNKHVVSKRPLDISEWEELDTIPPFGTYNQAIKMDNGDIYLFYRHGAHRSNWVYQKSTDNGRTFSEPVSFLKHKKRTDIKADDSWYAWVSRGQNNDIIVSYDYHLCWDNGAGINGRGHTTERHDAYFMVFDTDANSWTNINGTELTIPVTREVADIETLVARTGENWTFNGSAHLDEDGHPHIATNIGVDLGEKTGGPKQTSHFRWNGEQWVGGNPISSQSRIDGTDTRGDFILRSATDIRYILGYQEGSDGVIAYFDSQDSGETFRKTKELLRKPNANWALTTIIQNAHPDAQIIVAERQRGTNWRRVYLVGERGAITRNKQDALQLSVAAKVRPD